MAARHDVSFAVETKSLVKNFACLPEVQKDIQRLRNYRPLACPFCDGRDPEAFWNRSSQRWGVILIASFAGARARETWDQLASEEDCHRAQPLIGGYTPAQRQKWLDLRASLQEAGATTGSYEICSNQLLAGTDALHLLWASFPLLRSDEILGQPRS